MRLNPFADDPLTKLAKQLSSFIAVIKEVSPEDAGASSDVIRALAPMAENLSTLANAAKDIPNSGGFIGRFMGENDIDKFGKDLSGFISAFSNLSPQDAVDAGNVLEAMKPMIDNLKLFAAAARNIPNRGGFMGEFMGENDIDVFGTMLAGFVSAFADVTKDQAEKASEVLEAMKPMADNLKEFAYAAQEIPTAGGVVGTFLGTVDLATFSSQIRGLIGTFGSVNSTQLSLATQTLELMTDAMLPSLVKFSEFTNGLKNSGGVAQFFTGKIGRAHV